MDAFLSSAVEFFQWFISLPAQGYENLIRNSIHMWDDMSMLNYIRMIAIVGGYLFLRPYLQRWGERNQAKQHEKMLNEKEMQKKQEAKISPNALRGGGGKSVSFKEEESEEDKGKGEEWGKKAKKRQKKVVEILEEKKRVEEEEDDDKDIMEYLVDYEEGKDGW